MEDRATSGRVARSASGRPGRGATVRQIVDELGDWAVGSDPLFRQLARAIARGIERGVIAPGARLPAERALARAVSVSRGTAVAAYDELVADGLVERWRGSGTYAIGAGSLGLPPGREGSALVARLVDRSADEPGAVIDLSISVLHDAEALPVFTFGNDDLRRVVPDTGYSPWGLPVLRDRVAELVSTSGLPTRADEVVITTGAQQAITAAAACWVRPGDAVVVEDPTYPGAIAAFGAAGAELIGVPVDRYGVQVDALRVALERHPVLVYLQPSLHSPTGVVLADSRRRAIAGLLSDARVPLVEDNALAGLAWEKLPPPIAAHAPESPIAVVGSLSKLFWGGLRVGFVRAPAPVALRFARVKATHDLGSSAVSQLLAANLLGASDRDRLISVRNQELQRRARVLTDALAAALPSWSWTEPAGGLSLWVRLPEPVADQYAQVALRHGVAVATAEPLSASGSHADRLRLSFSAPEAELRDGVGRLAHAWRSWRSTM